MSSAIGQWVEYVGSGSAEQLCGELAGLDGIQQALDGGDIGVCPVGQFYAFYGDSDVVNPARSVEVRVAAAEKALAAGYTGFRAVVDCTAVARTPQHREAFARFEYLIDQKMSALPVTVLCAYDAGELGTAAVAEMACLHPLVNEGFTSFHLYADSDVDFALAGEIDLSCARTYTVLGEVPLPGAGAPWDWWARYEATINHAWDDFPVWGLCSYDIRTTPHHVLSDVTRTHPYLATADGRHAGNDRYTDPVEFPHWHAAPCSMPAAAPACPPPTWRTWCLR